MAVKEVRWTGIYRHGAGFRAVVSAGRGKPPRMRFFPKGTPVHAMQQWRIDERARLRVRRAQRASRGTFAGDAARYLRAVTALPTYEDRAREIDVWVEIFGTRRRDDITPADIREHRDYWLTAPRTEADPRPLAPGTVNKRLRALSNLFTVLDGSQIPNPVRDVPEAREPDAEARALSYDVIETIIEALPDLDRAERGKKRGTLSMTKIRIRCLAYSPITPRQLATITAADIDLVGGLLRLPTRKKGRGAKAIWCPIIGVKALDAFTDFHRHNCYGEFSVSSVRKSFKSAIVRAGFTLPRARLYDLRHSFGTLAYRATGSLEAVAKLMQHATTKTTQRYALEAEAEVVARHGARVAEHVAASKKPN